MRNFKSPHSNQKSLKWAVKVETASSQQVGCVQTTKVQGQKPDSFTSIFLIAYPPLLCETETEQIRQILGVSMAVKFVQPVLSLRLNGLSHLRRSRQSPGRYLMGALSGRVF